MATTLTILMKSFMFWKYRTKTITTTTGISFIGVGDPQAIEQFERLVAPKKLHKLTAEQLEKQALI